MKNQSKVERTSECELVVSRIINGPARLVFEAWAKPELFQKWWVPKSAPITLVSCEMDIRTGGKYRLTLSMGDQTMEFFGKYLEVTPYSRLVWTNEEGGADAAVITTVTFEETKGTTLVTVHDLYPSKKALDDAIASDSTGALPEQLEQLEQLLAEFTAARS
ncbi:MAG: SRPBCC domain-containing protein [Bdellovibrionia bacterium]